MIIVLWIFMALKGINDKVKGENDLSSKCIKLPVRKTIKRYLEPKNFRTKTINMMDTVFKLPSTISIFQGNKMIYGEYLAKMENCVWTIGYTPKNSTDFAISVSSSDYDEAKSALKKELIRLGQFN